MNILTANRLWAIAAFLTGLSGAILAITNSFPKNWQATSIAIAGILGAIATALHFMLGSQRHDANQAQIQLAQIQLEHAKVAQGVQAPEPALVAKPTLMQDNVFDHEALDESTGETRELTLDPDYNPESSLDPEHDVDKSVVTPPANPTE
jgi:hypothetical protein